MNILDDKGISTLYIHFVLEVNFFSETDFLQE